MDFKKEVIIKFKEPILKAIQYTREDFASQERNPSITQEQAEKSIEKYDILYRKISSGVVLSDYDYELLKIIIAYQAEKMANESKRLQEAASTMINIAKILHSKV